MRRLTFHFDYISHNAYLAWTQLPELAGRHGLEVEPVPVLFAGLLKANGQLGPAEIPPKARWMLRDVVRKAARLGVPLRPPASHPFNPLLPLRVTSQPLPPDERARLVDALFRAVWAEARDVSDPEVVASVATAAGLDGAARVAAASGDDARRRLREQTDAAIASGVFGVPSFSVDGEVFWGLDDLPHLELFLDGRDPLRGVDLEAWYRVRPSATRNRS